MARQQTAVKSKPHGTQWPSHRQLFISFPHQQRAGEAARAAGLPEGTPGAITGAAGLRNVDGMSDRGQGLNPLHVIGLNRVLKFVRPQSVPQTSGAGAGTQHLPVPQDPSHPPGNWGVGQPAELSTQNRPIPSSATQQRSIGPQTGQVFSIWPTRNSIAHWLQFRTVAEHPSDPDFLQYVAAVLTQANVVPGEDAKLSLVCARPQEWGIKHAPETEHFYVLFLPSVAQKAQSQPTPPSHTEPLVRWTHASSIAGVINILKEGRVEPSTSHFADSRSFFGMGYQISNNRDYDASQLGRVLHCCNQANKNSSLLLLGGFSWGPYSSQKSGGEWQALQATQNGGACNYNGMMIISCKTHQVRTVSWKVDAKPPLQWQF